MHRDTCSAEPLLGGTWQLISWARRLFGTNFNDAGLLGANLTNAGLTNASLDGAGLLGANLTGASFGSANLKGADLSGANLTGAKFTYANLTGALWPKNVPPPAGWVRDPRMGQLSRAKAGT